MEPTLPDANALYIKMLIDIQDADILRSTADLHSPRKGPTAEAVGAKYLVDPRQNLVTCRKVDKAWAIVNTLHFFANTEFAASLRVYNQHADKFLDGDYWKGAYGKIAMSQVYSCIHRLKGCSSSRRAVVTFYDRDWESDENQNIPACPSGFQFLVVGDLLHMLVSQRSLNVVGVMPYDLVQFTNIHKFVADQIGRHQGPFHWFIGSMHAPVPFEVPKPAPPDRLYIAHPDRNPDKVIEDQGLIAKLTEVL